MAILALKDNRPFYRKKRWIISLSFLFFIIVLFLLRHHILKSIGHYLVADDVDYTSEYYAVLGGNSAERGMAAVWIGRQQPQAKFITTGGNRPSQLAAIGINTYEAALTREKMVKGGISPTRIVTLNQGTSSKEEADLLLQYCQQNNIHQLTILSGQYHLRRLRMTYEPLFAGTGIEIKFFGAIEKDFDPDHWWESESGLIYTNNEYIKILYYGLKY
jgi:uncharacterized SAM-binding protein YcdF (DUF218 family)